MNCTGNCEEGLFQGSQFCCATPPIGGVADRMILVNWDNIESVVYSVDGVITDLMFKDNTKAFSFVGTMGSTNPSVTYTPSTYIAQYDHQIQFLAFETNQAAKDNYETLAQKPVVAIIEKAKGKTQAGDDAFEVFGIGVGMYMSALEYLPNNAENGGVYNITIKSSDNKAKEPKLPTSFFDTNYATTSTKLSGYLNIPFLYNVSPFALDVAGGNSVTVTGLGFFDSLNQDIVTSVDFVNSVGTLTNQATYTTVSNTSITFTSVALTAGTYSVRVTTENGVVQSKAIIVVS